MGEHAILDVRDLAVPETRHRMIDAIASFGPGDTLKLLIDRDPSDLYPVLDRAGFGHHAEPSLDAVYEVTIWPRAA
jgi:uncharacterized protein (DUF2249 family)